MEIYLNILKDKGYKITPQRRAVLTAFMNTSKFPTAQDILQEVRKTTPDISFDTIYRNLTLLTELGIIHEIFRSSGNVYELSRPGHHHHHLICTKCGKMECIDVCPMNPIYEKEARKKGFTITGHMFEFYGLCQDCNRKK